MFLKYYEMMKKNGVHIKRRTLAPIFEFSETHSFIFFNEAKVQGISLTIEDYCNILMNLTGASQISIVPVVEDMVKNINGPISQRMLTISILFLIVCLPHHDYHSTAPFVLSKKEKDKMLEKMKICGALWKESSCPFSNYQGNGCVSEDEV